MNSKDVSIRPVASFFIVLGAAIFAYGIVAWILNTWLGYELSVPSAKIMGGLIILALGYVVFELDMIRKES